MIPAQMPNQFDYKYLGAAIVSARHHWRQIYRY
jgi:hypothetical protein